MCVLLKVEEASYVFEAKTIQRMELLILSTLHWRVHPVTPISYLDHIIRRFSFKSHQQLEFLSRCESLLLSIVPGNAYPLSIHEFHQISWILVDAQFYCCWFSDSRFLSYSSSELAAAIMVSVFRGFKTCDESEYESQLMTLLRVDSVCGVVTRLEQ